MGHRFRSEAIVIRDLDEMTLIFFDSNTIYMYPKRYRVGTIFQKWGAQRGYSMEHWQPFRKCLRYNKNLTISDCYSLALTHDIASVATLRQLDLRGRKVKYIK